MKTMWAAVLVGHSNQVVTVEVNVIEIGDQYQIVDPSIDTQMVFGVERVNKDSKKLSDSRFGALYNLAKECDKSVKECEADLSRRHKLLAIVTREMMRIC